MWPPNQPILGGDQVDVAAVIDQDDPRLRHTAATAAEFTGADEEALHDRDRDHGSASCNAEEPRVFQQEGANVGEPQFWEDGPGSEVPPEHSFCGLLNPDQAPPPSSTAPDDPRKPHLLSVLSDMLYDLAASELHSRTSDTAAVPAQLAIAAECLKTWAKAWDDEALSGPGTSAGLSWASNFANSMPQDHSARNSTRRARAVQLLSSAVGLLSQGAAAHDGPEGGVVHESQGRGQPAQLGVTGQGGSQQQAYVRCRLDVVEGVESVECAGVGPSHQTQPVGLRHEDYAVVGNTAQARTMDSLGEQLLASYVNPVGGIRPAAEFMRSLLNASVRAVLLRLPSDLVLRAEERNDKTLESQSTASTLDKWAFMKAPPPASQLYATHADDRTQSSSRNPQFTDFGTSTSGSSSVQAFTAQSSMQAAAGSGNPPKLQSSLQASESLERDGSGAQQEQYEQHAPQQHGAEGGVARLADRPANSFDFFSRPHGYIESLLRRNSHTLWQDTPLAAASLQSRAGAPAPPGQRPSSAPGPPLLTRLQAGQAAAQEAARAAASQQVSLSLANDSSLLPASASQSAPPGLAPTYPEDADGAKRFDDSDRLSDTGFADIGLIPGVVSLMKTFSLTDRGVSDVSIEQHSQGSLSHAESWISKPSGPLQAASTMTSGAFDEEGSDTSGGDVKPKRKNRKSRKRRMQERKRVMMQQEQEAQLAARSSALFLQEALQGMDGGYAGALGDLALPHEEHLRQALVGHMPVLDPDAASLGQWPDGLDDSSGSTRHIAAAAAMYNPSQLAALREIAAASVERSALAEHLMDAYPGAYRTGESFPQDPHFRDGLREQAGIGAARQGGYERAQSYPHPHLQASRPRYDTQGAVGAARMAPFTQRSLPQQPPVPVKPARAAPFAPPPNTLYREPPAPHLPQGGHSPPHRALTQPLPLLPDSASQRAGHIVHGNELGRGQASQGGYGSDAKALRDLHLRLAQLHGGSDRRASLEGATQPQPQHIARDAQSRVFASGVQSHGEADRLKFADGEAQAPPASAAARAGHHPFDAAALKLDDNISYAVDRALSDSMVKRPFAPWSDGAANNAGNGAADVAPWHAMALPQQQQQHSGGAVGGGRGDSRTLALALQQAAVGSSPLRPTGALPGGSLQAPALGASGASEVPSSHATRMPPGYYNYFRQL